MSVVKFTAALNVIGTPWHVTLVFCDAKHAGKVSTTAELDSGVITDVVYWPESNVTVALIDSVLIKTRHQYYVDKGYSYDGYDYKPHATLSRGNTTILNSGLIGCTVILGEEYVRTWSK